MKNRWFLAAAAIGLLVTVAAGAQLLLQTKGPRIEAYTAVRRPLVQSLVASGRVAARRRSELGAMTQSTVAEVPVEEGDHVEAAALLLRLVDDEAIAQRAEAEAAVREAEARLERVTGVGRRLASEQLRQARIDAEQAERDFQRQRQLQEAGSATEAALERARQVRDQSRSRRIAAALELAGTSTDGAEAEATAAALARAEARLQAAQIAVERTQIRAPSAGVILERRAEVGEVVRPGEPLLVFAGEGPLEVVLRLDEANLAQLARGQAAVVSPDAFPSLRLDAIVRRIAPAVDAQRGTIEVTLALRDEDARFGDAATEGPSTRLRPDMTVSAEITSGRSDDALVLLTTLVRDAGGERPWVLTVRDGVAERQDVSLGLRGDDLVEIHRGLDEDTPVIDPGVDVLPGEAVRLRRVVPAVDGAAPQVPQVGEAADGTER